jgi:hypothetical protein
MVYTKYPKSRMNNASPSRSSSDICVKVGKKYEKDCVNFTAQIYHTSSKEGFKRRGKNLKMFSRCSQDVLKMFSRCSQDVLKMFSRFS